MNDLMVHLLTRLQDVLRNLGFEHTSDNGPNTRFADMIDSMGMVEFLAVVANDFSVKPDVIEQSVNHRFGTIAELAAALHAAGIMRCDRPQGVSGSVSPRAFTTQSICGWLAVPAIRLPNTIESAAEMDRALQRPRGWFESHTGIKQRRTWKDQDAVGAAVAACREALERSGLTPTQVGALLVVSEAPPVLIGLGAILHHHLQLPGSTVALEIGGACTAFLAAVWTAQALLPQRGVILIISVEAATCHLRIEPGPSGEGAALFGDAAAASVLFASPASPDAVPLGEISLAWDGSQASLLQVRNSATGGVELRMRGTQLASCAIHVMADSAEALAKRRGIGVQQLAAVVAHGGNGRMPALLARKLGLPRERVWSETAVTGNVGSASLPVASAAHQPPPKGPVIWTAVGAGLAWGGLLSGKVEETEVEEAQ